VRLLVPVDSLRPRGGIERSAMEVTEALAGRGHTVLTPYREDGALRDRWEAVAQLQQVRSFAWRRHAAPADTWALRGTLRGSRAFAPDAIWLNRSEHLVWGLLAARWTGAGLVVHLRQPPTYRVTPWVDRRVHRWLAVSEAVAASWRERGATGVEVVPNGVDPLAYPAPTGRAPGRTVLYLGRFAPEKGLDILARAWPLVPDADLVAAGTGDGSSLRARHRATVLPEQVDVVPLLQDADVLVLPSTWQEPFGRVVVEALSAGVPVVASAVGGIPEILTGELAAGLVPAGDHVALAAAIERALAQGPQDRARCRQHVAERFSLTRTAAAVEAALLAAAT
jgi:glycosyltransferase involved in cell wall biosynthesis